MINQNFVILGAILSLIGGLQYIKETIAGRTRPNRVTWFMWALAPLIAFGAELHEHVGLPALMTFIVGFNPLMIFIASFVNNKSVWKLTRFDLGCGILSLVGLVLWLITRHGTVAIAFSIAADGLAALPTFVKSYKDPDSESWLVYLMGGISATLTLLSLDHWGLADFGFPLYILLINIVLVALVKYKLGLRLRRIL